MFKKNYYYIVAGLADIIPDQSKLPYSLNEFKSELEEHLSAKDFKILQNIFLSIDNKNLLNILSKNNADFIEGGKYPKDRMEAAVRDPDFDENYLNVFTNAYKSETPIFEGYDWEDQITWMYYDYMIYYCNNSFIKKYFEINQTINNVIVALNARKFNIKDRKIILGNSDISQALRSSTLKDFGLSSEFPLIEKIISIYDNDNLVYREKSIDKIKWDLMDEFNTFNYFTVEVVYAYIIKLMMVDRWIKLDEKTGKEMFDKLINDLNNSFEFSKEFEVGRR